MKCNIEYIGKSRQGIPKYFCTAHKAFAYDKFGNELDECLWINKELYDNKLDLKPDEIKSIIVKYENILESVIPKIIINKDEFHGVIEYESCRLTYKDFGGILLAKLNDVPLESVKCSHCDHDHSDNGKFAYSPHRTHLCNYCGHLFRVKEKNIGSELATIFDIPKIELKENLLQIENSCCVEYDMLRGTVLVNHQNGDKVLFKDKQIDLVAFINSILENEF